MKPTKHYFNIPITIEPDKNRFSAYLSSRPDVRIIGDTKEEAFIRAVDVVAALLRGLHKRGEPLPDGLEVNPVPKG